MVFIVEFADGSAAQVNATNQALAKRLALTKFRDRIIMSVREAGLLEMSYRQPPTAILKS